MDARHAEADQGNQPGGRGLPHPELGVHGHRVAILHSTQVDHS